MKSTTCHAEVLPGNPAGLGHDQKMKTLTEHELEVIDGGNLVGPLPAPHLQAPQRFTSANDPWSLVPSYLQG